MVKVLLDKGLRSTTSSLRRIPMMDNCVHVFRNDAFDKYAEYRLQFHVNEYSNTITDSCR